MAARATAAAQVAGAFAWPDGYRRRPLAARSLQSIPPNSGCVASATSRPGYTPHPKAPIPLGRQVHSVSANLITSLATLT
jgi:hypothetical protein